MGMLPDSVLPLHLRMNVRDNYIQSIKEWQERTPIRSVDGGKQ
jgi:hypothetical protein